MPLILRLDVDKPYGNSTFKQRIMSKLAEDYWFPILPRMGYLHAVKTFLRFCNSENISCMMYFRHCNAPDQETLDLLDEGNHVFGFHAENTRSFETFRNEFQAFQNKFNNRAIQSFTKHGSGYYRLGKNHFAPYEPEKYIAWANQLGLKFSFGNQKANCRDNFQDPKDFYPKMFWLESEHQENGFTSLNEIVDIANNNIVPIITHPENFCSRKEVRDSLQQLVQQARQMNISWITI
jgi:hypothetical protein